MTLAELQTAQYIKYTHSKETMRLADYIMCKMLKDSFGKKYQITIYVYHYDQHVSFMPHVQFGSNDITKAPCIDVTYHVDKHALADVENFYEQLWCYLGSNYYETYAKEVG